MQKAEHVLYTPTARIIFQRITSAKSQNIASCRCRIIQIAWESQYSSVAAQFFIMHEAMRFHVILKTHCTTFPSTILPDFANNNGKLMRFTVPRTLLAWADAVQESLYEFSHSQMINVYYGQKKRKFLFAIKISHFYRHYCCYISLHYLHQIFQDFACTAIAEHIYVFPSGLLKGPCASPHLSLQFHDSFASVWIHLRHLMLALLHQTCLLQLAGIFCCL